jgi:RNA polymerase sigma-70 factor (ECF subfamily)
MGKMQLPRTRGTPLPASDEELMVRVCDGDDDALGVLFRRYARVVRGVAYKVLRDASEADDMVQDIFLLIRRLCKTFDSSKGPTRFWILQMTYHRAISRRRYLSSRHFYTHQDLDQVENMPRDRMVAAGPRESIQTVLEQRETLQVAFAELSEDQRETLMLYFFEGLAFEEIAAKLGQTIGNVKHHYYRGLDKLRQQVFQSKSPTASTTPIGAEPYVKRGIPREQARRESIVRIARQSEELGDYDRFIPPEE